MYAIAFKIGPRSAWRMFSETYGERVKCDIAIAALKRGELLPNCGAVYKAQRIFFEEDM